MKRITGIFILFLFFVCFLTFSAFALGASADENTAAGNTADGTSSEPETDAFDMYGDADNSGTVDAADARFVLRTAVSLEKIEPDSLQFYTCDVDYDGKITSADARIILRASVKLEKLDPSSPHRHEWGEWKVTKKASCTQSGTKERYCKFDTDRLHIDRESIPASSHTLTFYGDKDYYKCSGCGKIYEDAKANTEIKDNGNVNTVPVSSSIKSKCDKICKTYSAVSAQAAIIKNGVVVNTYVYGVTDKQTGRAVNESTIYRAASLSKLVTDMVFMALQDRGIVHENDDISAYFGYKCRNPRYPNVVITPSMLMCHSASYVSVGGTELADRGLASKGYYYNVKPGTKFNYSDIGIAVLGCLCENATGEYLNTLAHKYIFDPLNITASFVTSELDAKSRNNFAYIYGENGGLTLSKALSITPKPLGKSLKLAPGNINISARDYAKIVSIFLNKGRGPDGTRILSEASVKAILTQRMKDDGGVTCGYGNQLERNLIKGKTVHMHTGSAYGMFATYMICPEDNAGVVVLTSGCVRNKDKSCHDYCVCRDLIRALYPC